MGYLTELTRAVMESGSHPVAQIEDEDIFVVDNVGDAGQLTVYAHVLESLDQIAVYSIRPDRAPEQVRSTMAEFFTRANWRLAVGNFELDLADGEMRFKVGIDAEGGELGAPVVTHMLRTVVAAMDTFAPGIDRVLAGEVDTVAILDDLAAA